MKHILIKIYLASKDKIKTSHKRQANLRLNWSGFDPGGGYSHTLPIRVCAAQRGRDFEAPGLERGIHFRGVF